MYGQPHKVKPNPVLTQAWRRAVLTLHVGSAVGWLGVSAGMLVLSIVGRSTPDATLRHAAYAFMHDFDLALNIPLGFLALLTGIALSVWTQWGLFSHYWILTKFIATIAVLVFATVFSSRWVHEATASAASAVAAPVFTLVVLNAAGFLATFFAMTTLSVFKPWGKTPRGKRIAVERAASARSRGSFERR